MDCITLGKHLQSLELIEDGETLSLYRAFEQMSDHQQKRGVRYSLAITLSLVVLGQLAGMTSLEGIAEWVRLRIDWLKAVLPLTRAICPVPRPMAMCCSASKRRR